MERQTVKQSAGIPLSFFSLFLGKSFFSYRKLNLSRATYIMCTGISFAPPGLYPPNREHKVKNE